MSKNKTNLIWCLSLFSCAILILNSLTWFVMLLLLNITWNVQVISAICVSLLIVVVAVPHNWELSWSGNRLPQLPTDFDRLLWVQFYLSICFSILFVFALNSIFKTYLLLCNSVWNCRQMWFTTEVSGMRYVPLAKKKVCLVFIKDLEQHFWVWGQI